jgi:hypothetical protein
MTLPHTCAFQLDTYKFARNAGDMTFIHWIYMRLHLVHRESELVDYMHTLKAFEQGINSVVEDADRWNKLPRFIKWWFSRD